MTDALASMNSKFWGAYHPSRRIRSPGSLTLVSGGASVRPFPRLSLELRPVHVNCVAPAMVRTEAHDHMEPQKREQSFEKLRNNLPVGHAGEPEDIAMQIIGQMQNPFASGSIAHISGGGLLI
jgi:NAD(P)-dependent dehydrogenase (short-subunit alcohol dehydrogenase family)